MTRLDLVYYPNKGSETAENGYEPLESKTHNPIDAVIALVP